MSEPLRIVIAQINLHVGNFSLNTDKIIDSIDKADKKYNADIIIFPELSVTGYPPEDLLYRKKFHDYVKKAIDSVSDHTKAVDVIIGHPLIHDNRMFNACSYISKGRIEGTYCKQVLPNYKVFDEKRYFEVGSEPFIFSLKGIPAALSICEDIWQPGPCMQAKTAGARLVLNINASPYHINKQTIRENILQERVADSGLNIVYVNLVGGQDELIFDGGSMAINSEGNIDFTAPRFTEDLYALDFITDGTRNYFSNPENLSAGKTDEDEDIYNALVLGVRDYVKKNNFNGVVIGLSGGIDSALTTSIAADALGAENVETLIMPSRFTAKMSIDDAIEQSENLGIKYHIISIEELFKTFTKTLKPVFTGYAPDITEENIQARCRGVILMAISNKTGKLVLTTGNKSELSVGYATLYGDMAGGFSPLKDVSKTLVYRLAQWKNRQEQVIPRRVIDRPPSAELREDQKDVDVLPPYEILDPVLEMYIEHDMDPETIINQGYDKNTVYEVVRLVDRNEYKRRQAAPGIRITERAFGRDRRYPITSGYREY